MQQNPLLIWVRLCVFHSWYKIIITFSTSCKCVRVHVCCVCVCVCVCLSVSVSVETTCRSFRSEMLCRVFAPIALFSLDFSLSPLHIRPTFKICKPLRQLHAIYCTEMWCLPSHSQSFRQLQCYLLVGDVLEVMEKLMLNMEGEHPFCFRLQSVN